MTVRMVGFCSKYIYGGFFFEYFDSGCFPHPPLLIPEIGGREIGKCVRQKRP